MDVDHKSSIGSFSTGPNPKKRQISFRLTIPSKQPKLPYQQRTGASRYTSFLLERNQFSPPDTPTSSTTAALDEDPFYDSDTDVSINSISPVGTNPYTSTHEYDLPSQHFSNTLFTSSRSTSTESSSMGPSNTTKPAASWSQTVQDKLKKAYQVVAERELFKDSPVWSAMLAARLNPPAGAYPHFLTRPFLLILMF